MRKKFKRFWKEYGITFDDIIDIVGAALLILFLCTWWIPFTYIAWPQKGVYKMANNTIIWEVQHYGEIIHDFQETFGGEYVYRNKVYFYDERYFSETWCNGYRLSFNELI